MKGNARGGLRPRTQTALFALCAIACSAYVAGRMISSSLAADALVRDLDDADGAGAGDNLADVPSLSGRPRLENDPAAIVPGFDAYDADEGESGDGAAGVSLLGQLDGVRRGVANGWGCEVGVEKGASIAVYVDGFLVATVRPTRVRADRTVGKICARHPYDRARVGFAATLPQLAAGAHEIRAFVRDASGARKAELGGSPFRYVEAPTALGVRAELARKDARIREQNRVIAELQNQLGADAELWRSSEGPPDAWGGGRMSEARWREVARAGGADSEQAAHALHESAAGGASAGVHADGHVSHAVTLKSDAGKPGGKEPLLAFVGVNTGFSSKARRDVLRATWFPAGSELAKMETQHGILFRFVIGEPVASDEALNKALEEEISEHDDFFRLKHTDTYDKLSDKTVMWFSAAVTTVEADFYMKIDDDIHLRVPALEKFLVSHRLTRSMYFGCMKSGPVLSNPKVRWHEPEWWRFGDSGNRYFRHSSGQIYGVSRVVAQYIHDHRSILHRFANEDVSVGSWVMGLDVDFVDERNMCCQDCRGQGKCIATFQWRCSGVCEPLTNIPVIHNSCPQHPVASKVKRDALGKRAELAEIAAELDNIKFTPSKELFQN